MSVDWRGLSMVMAQLKDISEPGKMELMEREYELRAMENTKKRAFEESKYIFDAQQEAYEENRLEIDRVRENIIGMNAGALNLKEEHQSPQFHTLVDENDKQYKNRLDKLNGEIETKLEGQVTNLTNLTNLYENMTYGKQIRETQGGDKYNTVTQTDYARMSGEDWTNLNAEERASAVDEFNKTMDDEWTIDSLNKFIIDRDTDTSQVSDIIGTQEIEVGWDIDDSGTLSNEEFAIALEDTLKDMKENNQDTIGIAEGFYSGFNPIENEQDNVSVLSSQVALDQALLNLKEDEEEDDGIYKKANKEIKKKLYKEQEQEKLDKIEAMTEYRTYTDILDKSQEIKNGASKYKKVEGGYSREEYVAAKKKVEEYTKVLGPDIMNLMRDNPQVKEGYGKFNNSDYIDHGFDEVLQSELKKMELKLPNMSDMENFKLNLEIKNEFNWMVENWDSFHDKGLNTEDRQKFIDTYKEFKKMFPSHFDKYSDAKSDDILSQWD